MRSPRDFWRQVRKTKTCWLWMGATDRWGYGTCSYLGHRWRAHRLAWALTHGHPPPDQDLRHYRCGVRLCVRPDHLRLGTAQDNADDYRRHHSAWRGAWCRAWGIPLDASVPIPETSRYARAVAADRCPKFGEFPSKVARRRAELLIIARSR